MKKFDGDYDILLSKVVEREVQYDNPKKATDNLNRVKSIFTVRDLIEDAFYTLNEKNKLQGTKAIQMIKTSNFPQKVYSGQQTLIDNLIEEYPELQISVPVHVEDLEDPSYIPPVAFVTKEAYEGTAEYLVAYKESETVLLDAKNEPENAVVVIGLNERIDDPLKPIIDEAPPTPNLRGGPTESGIRLFWDIDNINSVNFFRIYKISSQSLYLL